MRDNPQNATTLAGGALHVCVPKLEEIYTDEKSFGHSPASSRLM